MHICTLCFKNMSGVKLSVCFIFNYAEFLDILNYLRTISYIIFTTFQQCLSYIINHSKAIHQHNFCISWLLCGCAVLHVELLRIPPLSACQCLFKLVYRRLLIVGCFLRPITWSFCSVIITSSGISLDYSRLSALVKEGVTVVHAAFS